MAGWGQGGSQRQPVLAPCCDPMMEGHTPAHKLPSLGVAVAGLLKQPCLLVATIIASHLLNHPLARPPSPPPGANLRMLVGSQSPVVCTAMHTVQAVRSSSVTYSAVQLQLKVPSAPGSVLVLAKSFHT